nr:MOSC N-terminal beta barrel domain-containing protein [Leucobacter luti]
MATVVALSRYPVKGCTPEPVQSLLVQDDGRISGDRVLAFRFADAVEPEDRDGLDSWPKAGGAFAPGLPSAR